MNVEPKLTIAIPVYNGERFLKEKIESILKLGYKNFELIISDNASLDNTKKICQEFIARDNRIKYFLQNETIKPEKNFEILLRNSRGEFFMWTAVDDVIMPGFIEKNLEILTNKKIVCSASQVQYYGEKTERLKKMKPNLRKKILQKFSPLKNIPAEGDLEQKIRKYLKARGHHHIFYGIFRREQLQKLFVSEIRSGFDWATILNCLKIGDFYVLDEVLMLRYDGGYSSGGFFNYKRALNIGFFATLFHYIPFTKWCFRNLGKKNCFRNFDLILLLNLEGIFYFVIDVLRKIRR